MDIKNLVLILLILMIAIVIIIAAYLYLRERTISEIRADVYHLFLIAEHTFTATPKGKQKMEWVIQQTRVLLPKWAQLFITDALLEKALQNWFDMVKDLLDDGKFNKTIKK